MQSEMLLEVNSKNCCMLYLNFSYGQGKPKLSLIWYWLIIISDVVADLMPNLLSAMEVKGLSFPRTDSFPIRCLDVCMLNCLRSARLPSQTEWF